MENQVNLDETIQNVMEEVQAQFPNVLVMIGNLTYKEEDGDTNYVGYYGVDDGMVIVERSALKKIIETRKLLWRTTDTNKIISPVAQHITATIMHRLPEYRTKATFQDYRSSHPKDFGYRYKPADEHFYSFVLPKFIPFLKEVYMLILAQMPSLNFGDNTWIGCIPSNINMGINDMLSSVFDSEKVSDICGDSVTKLMQYRRFVRVHPISMTPVIDYAVFRDFVAKLLADRRPGEVKAQDVATVIVNMVKNFEN